MYLSASCMDIIDVLCQMISRLGKLMRASTVEEILRYCEEFFPGEPPEFFFDRNPENFPAILDMYRSVS